MRTTQVEPQITFEKRIKLSQKYLFDFPRKPELVGSSSPIDFFYNDNCAENALSNFKTILNLKRVATENKLVHSFIHYLYKINNFFRQISSIGYLLLNQKNYNRTIKTFGSLSPKSSEYIDEWAKVGNSCCNKTININLEDRIIEKLVEQNKNSVFIINHSNITKDKYIYTILNSFLNYGYSAHNMQKECPRPQIIVSKSVFTIARDSLKKLYKNLGLLPINTQNNKKAYQDNISVIKGITDNFSAGTINLFTFPEGTNSIFKNRVLKDKFQLKSIKLIENLLKKTKEVQIVPVGVSYDNVPNSFGNINMGAPIVLKYEDNIVTCKIDKKIYEIGKLSKPDTHNKLQSILSNLLQENIEKSKYIKK